MEYIHNHHLVAGDAAMVLIADNKRCLHAQIQLVVSVKESFAVLVDFKYTFFHAIAADTEREIRTAP